MSEDTQSGVNEHVAAAPQSQEIPSTPPPAVEQKQPDSQEVNWQQARETMAQQKQQLDELAQQNQLLQQQQAMIQANAMQQAPQNVQSADPLQSMSDDDVLTGADFKKAIAGQVSQFQSALDKQSQQVKQMAMQSQYPDYQEVVGYTLRNANNDPALAQAIASSSDPQLLAYQLGKANPEYQQAQQAKKHSADAQRIVENSQKPSAVSTAATGSGALSRADWFLNCSDRDLEQHIAKVKAGA